MKVWIVVEECEKYTYAAPTPTGKVFADEAKAKAYVESINADPKTLLFLDLMAGELEGVWEKKDCPPIFIYTP